MTIPDATCARCDKPATGYAMIGDKRYCHEGPDPTCYMLASWENAGVTDGVPFEEPKLCRTCLGYGALPLHGPDGEIDDSEPCPDCVKGEPVRWARCAKNLGGGSFCTLHRGHGIPCADEEPPSC